MKPRMSQQKKLLYNKFIQIANKLGWAVTNLPPTLLKDPLIEKPQATATHFSDYGEMYYIEEVNKRYKLIREDYEGKHDLTGETASVMFCQLLEMIPAFKKKVHGV